jgi:hypothetical protein
VVRAKVAFLAYRLGGTIQCFHWFSHHKRHCSISEVCLARNTEDSRTSVTLNVERPSLSLDYQLPDTLCDIINGENVALLIQLHNRGEAALQDILLSVRFVNCGSTVSGMDGAESGSYPPVILIV